MRLNNLFCESFMLNHNFFNYNVSIIRYMSDIPIWSRLFKVTFKKLHSLYNTNYIFVSPSKNNGT